MEKQKVWRPKSANPIRKKYPLTDIPREKFDESCESLLGTVFVASQ